MTTNHTTERFNPCETEACKARCDRFGVACEDIAIDEVERLRAEVAELRDEREAMAKQEPVAHCAIEPLRGDEYLRRHTVKWVNGSPIEGPLFASPVHIPEGYALVPIEPTPEMLDRAVSFALNVTIHGDYGWTQYMRDLWERMRGAAPKHPTSTEGGAG